VHVYSFAGFYELNLNCASTRWKWGSSNVTGKVDEVVTEGQAQVQSNKVRIPYPLADTSIAVIWMIGLFRVKP
jgi:hypothetical protein